jgi:hypothetical protein
MPVSSRPVSTWVAQLLALSGIAQSASLTVTVNITGAWEAQIPIIFSHAASQSADPTVNVYASMDGGATYDSNPFTQFSLARTPTGAGSRQQSLRLSTGQYAIQLVNAGPSSAFFGVGTQLQITGVVNA